MRIMKITIAFLVIVLTGSVCFAGIFRGNEEIIAETAISVFFVDGFGPIQLDYTLADRLKPEEVHATKLGEPVFSTYGVEIFYSSGYFWIVFYANGYTRVCIVIDEFLYLAEDRFVFRDR